MKAYDIEQLKGGIESIISGGGWKNPPKEQRVKIKVLAAVVLTIFAASGGIYFYPDYGIWTFAPSLVLLIAAGVLFCFEHPITLWGPKDGDHDIRKLYGRSPNSCQTIAKNTRDEAQDA